MSSVTFGVALWSQATDWPSFLAAGRLADRLRFDHLWTWDHLLSIFGTADQPVLEGWTAISALAATTEHVRLGLFVGANTFRNPALVVKSAVTLDHVSGGRAMLGIGGAWFEAEHRAFGLDFGRGFGERLDWLAEAAGAMRALLDGEEVTSAPGGRYAFDHLRIHPGPVQARLPMVVGGTGERKTLRIVAEHADIWNAFGTPDVLAAKDAILREHCAAVGRDPDEIVRTVGCKITIRRSAEDARRAIRTILEHNRTDPAVAETDHTFWTGTPEMIAETMAAYRRIGFSTFIVELPAPYDEETLEALMTVVKPMVERDGN